MDTQRMREGGAATASLVKAATEVAMPKRSFMRATEIWMPSADGRHLEFSNGLYGPLSDFERVSRQTRFGFDEGLPGKAWAAGHPIVLKDLVGSYFKRGEAAQAAGLTCALALPVFAGDALIAVMVLFCGDDREHVGAVEVWHAASGAIEMRLVDGYYGTADVFEWYSRHIGFMCGIGLPGAVWETGMPVVLADLGRSRRFVRWESAERVGINRGVAIPCGRDPGDPWVLTFLSALDTPIANRFETWIPITNGSGLVFDAGYCEHGVDLAAVYRSVVISPDAGTFGRVLNTGAPAIATDVSLEPHPVSASVRGTSLTSMVAMPVLTAGRLDAVVAWYL